MIQILCLAHRAMLGSKPVDADPSDFGDLSRSDMDGGPATPPRKTVHPPLPTAFICASPSNERLPLTRPQWRLHIHDAHSAIEVYRT
jgi:hypothetical protein